MFVGCISTGPLLRWTVTDPATRGETHVPDCTGTDANKIAHYMLRWVNTRGEKGPWSETASATIGA